jgi:hypothetical protein
METRRGYTPEVDLEKKLLSPKTQQDKEAKHGKRTSGDSVGGHSGEV